MREESDNITITDEAVAAISVSALLHAAQHFNHPQDVLAAEQIDKDEKRAILASWASDQFAVDPCPSCATIRERNTPFPMMKFSAP